ncbi:MAG: hypothetical protein JWR15_4253 [Prosthecobacter sp.]|nr:hypothetical protein [Prosthecobacter sp.]
MISALVQQAVLWHDSTAPVEPPAFGRNAMTHKFEVQVEPFMMRQAWNAWFFAKGLTWKLPVALMIMLAAVYMHHSAEGLDTLSIIYLTTIGMLILVFIFGYLIGLRRSIDKLNTIIDGKAFYTFSDTTIEASSSLGSVALAWSAIGEVRIYGDLVLLGFRGAMYSVLPKSQVHRMPWSFFLIVLEVLVRRFESE